MTQPDRHTGKAPAILRRCRHACRERRPRYHPATPAAPRMTAMLRHFQRARLRQVEYLARDRIAHRRRRRQRRPAAPAGRRNMLLHTVRDGRPAQRLALVPRLTARLAARLVPQATGSTLCRRLLQPVARRRLAAVAAVQTKTVLQRRYPLNKTRVLLTQPGILTFQTRDLPLGCLGTGHRQSTMRRFGTTHGKVDSFSNPRVNPFPTLTSWAVTTKHDISRCRSPEAADGGRQLPGPPGDGGSFAKAVAPNGPPGA